MTADFYADPDANHSIQMLTEKVLEINHLTANLRKAVDVWAGGQTKEPGVRAATIELLRVSRAMPAVAPSSKFPNDATVIGWLDVMEDFLANLSSMTRLDVEARKNNAAAFAQCTVELLRFLQGVNIDSGSFWEYFRPRKDEK